MLHILHNLILIGSQPQCLLQSMAASVDEGTCLEDYLGESEEVAEASGR